MQSTKLSAFPFPQSPIVVDFCTVFFMQFFAAHVSCIFKFKWRHLFLYAERFNAGYFMEAKKLRWKRR